MFGCLLFSPAVSQRVAINSLRPPPLTLPTTKTEAGKVLQGSRTTNAPARSMPPARTGQLPPYWEERKDPAGRTYYSNTKTETTTWQVRIYDVWNGTRNIPRADMLYFFDTLTIASPSSFGTSRGHRCRPFSPPVLNFKFLSRIGFSNPTARRLFIECCYLTLSLLALSASQIVHSKSLYEFIRVCIQRGSNSRN